MLYVLKMMMCSSSQNVNLPEGHIPSLVRITTQPLGAALRSTLPSLSSSTSCTNSFRTNLTKKKHVERLGLKVAYHRNHGMYIYILCVCVCACVIIYIIYICATTWYLVGLKLWHTMVYPDTPSMAILMILRESDVWTKDFFNTGDKGHHIWLKMRLRNRFEIC